MKTLSNTVFGADNILQYAKYNQFEIYDAMKILIKTAGLIWFVRGCVLLVQSSAPGAQHGPKGLVFLCSGVIAMNFEETVQFLNFV
jgi:hypothetical protein